MAVMPARAPEAGAVAYRPARGYRWFWGAACIALDGLGVTGFFLLRPFSVVAILPVIVLLLCIAAWTYGGAMVARSFVVVDDDGIRFRNARRVYGLRWEEILRVKLGAEGRSRCSGDRGKSGRSAHSNGHGSAIGRRHCPSWIVWRPSWASAGSTSRRRSRFPDGRSWLAQPWLPRGWRSFRVLISLVTGLS